MSTTPDVASTAATRIRRVIVIDGEIGAGKSVALRLFEEAVQGIVNPQTNRPYVVTAIQEPVDKWREQGALERFMKDPERYALFFQSYVFTTRIQSILNALDKRPDTDLLLLERSVLSDRYLFMQGLRALVSPQEMTMYREMWALHVQLLKPVGVHLEDHSTTHYVYLKPRMDLCMARVANRGRPEEVKAADSSSSSSTDAKTCGVTLAYQQSLRKSHEVLFEHATLEPGMEVPTFPRRVTVLQGAVVDANYSVPGQAQTNLKQALRSICVSAFQPI